MSEESNIQGKKQGVEREIVRLWELIRNFADSMEEIRNRASEYEGIESEYKDMLEGNNSAVNKMRESLRQATEEKNELREELENLNAEFRELKELLSDKDEMLEVADRQLEEKNQEISRLAEISTQFDKMKSDLDFAQKEITRKNFDLVNRDETINKIKEEKALLVSGVTKAGELKKRLDEYEELKQKAENEKVELLENIQNLEEKLDTAEISNTKYKEKINNLESDAVNNREEVSRLNSELEKSDVALKAGEDKIKSLNENIQSFEKEIKELKVYKDVLPYKDKKIEELTVSVQKLSALKVAGESGIEKLRNRINELQVKLTRLDEEKQDYDSKLAELTSSLEGEKKKIKETTRQLAEKNNEIIILRDRLGKFESVPEGSVSEKIFKENGHKSITEIEDTLKLAEEQKQQLEEKLKSLESIIEEKESLITLQSEALIQKEESMERLRKYSEELERQKEISSALFGRLHKLSDSKKMVEDENSDLKENNLKLDELLRQRYKQIKLLEGEINTLLNEREAPSEDNIELAGKIDFFVKKLEKKIKEELK